MTVVVQPEITHNFLVFFLLLFSFQEWFDMPAEQNTKVYVSDLPLDITQDEFIEVMSKCGMIFRDPQTNKMKVKLYAEPDGQLKGDGLCHYIKVRQFKVFPYNRIFGDVNK